jgi:trehalose 6-phosphate synthase/phosphatase
MDKFYLGFCNSTIWPVFHYFPTLAKFESQHWEIYKEVNEIFATKILEVANTDDIIWIHDYHLMLVPSIIRKKLGDNCKIGFFLHIPFPSFEVYRVMPRSWREEILKGLLGSDFIGFHTNEYSYSFLRCLLRILRISNNLGRLNYENRYIKVDTFPMGINFNKFDTAVEKEEVKTESKNIKNTLKDFKIILSVDRLDYTKGVPNRLKAFSKFLENNPQYLKKVVFILVIVPSRIGINKYDDLKNNLDKLISDINGKFQTMDWQPVIYQYRHIPFANLAALYYTSDIAMITPLRDGMNLMAKEYLASKKEAWVLILSEMAGATKELGNAIIVNPNDIDEMIEAIKKALEMLENNMAEVNLKLKIMRERIKNYDVFRWVNDFIDTLDNIKASYRKLQVTLLNDNEKTKIIKDFKKANKRIIFLDYDGTLILFYGRGKEAIADSNLLKLLEQLSEICDVCVIIGRDKNFIKKNIPLEK